MTATCNRSKTTPRTQHSRCPGSRGGATVRSAAMCLHRHTARWRGHMSDGATSMLLREGIVQAMEGLDEREWKVITMRVEWPMAGSGRSRVSDKIGLTKERIRERGSNVAQMPRRRGGLRMERLPYRRLGSRCLSGGLSGGAILGPAVARRVALGRIGLHHTGSGCDEITRRSGTVEVLNPCRRLASQLPVRVLSVPCPRIQGMDLGMPS